MRSLCVFVHYSEKNYIPEYVLTYLSEISHLFSDVILATNNRDIDNIFQINKLNNIKTFLFKNEGYDFGLFYKSIHSTDVEIYDRVAFINDSNILLKSLKDTFDWSKDNIYDVWGLTDSYENVPNSKHVDGYHIQSHFLVFEKAAIRHIYKFFDSIKFERYFDLHLNKREIWLKIVEDCEIGMSQYMKKQGLSLGAKYGCKDFVKKGNYKTINTHMRMWKELLEDKYPLIKKKIITQAFDPVHEKNVATNIDANSAQEYMETYRQNTNWKINL